jgi:hypothetical protein
MLPILGLLMFVSYIVEGVFHRPAGSLIHLVSLVACVSFVGEFIRSRAVAIKNRKEDQLTDVLPATRQANRSLDSELAHSKQGNAVPSTKAASALAQGASNSTAMPVVRC